MANPLALCDKCGLVFTSSLIALGSNSSAAFENVGVTCPQCGADAGVVNGIHETLGNTLRVLIDAKRSPSQIQALIDALKRLQATGASREEIEATLDKQAPDLPALLGFLKDRENRKEIYIVLGLLIALLVNYLKNSDCPPTQVKGLVEQTVSEATKPKPIMKPVLPPNAPNRKARRTQQSKARHR